MYSKSVVMKNFREIYDVEINRKNANSKEYIRNNVYLGSVKKRLTYFVRDMSDEYRPLTKMQLTTLYTSHLPKDPNNGSTMKNQ